MGQNAGSRLTVAMVAASGSQWLTSQAEVCEMPCAFAWPTLINVLDCVDPVGCKWDTSSTRGVVLVDTPPLCAIAQHTCVCVAGFYCVPLGKPLHEWLPKQFTDNVW